MPGLIDPKALDAHIQSWQSPAQFNVGAVSNVHNLTAALHAGQINQNQWNQQFKVIQAKQPGNKPVGGYTLTDALHNAVHQGANLALQVPKAAQSTAQQVSKQIKYLSGPTSTQQQRTAVSTNQQKAQTASPQTQDLFKQAPAHAKVQAAALLAKGHKESAVQTYLNKQVALGNQQTMTGLSNALVLGSVNVAGGGLLSKALGVAKTASGRDAAVSGLIDAQRAAQATKAATVADRLGAPAVKEANTTHIPVTEPTTLKIPVQGKSTQVVGKASTVSSSNYVKQSQQLSKAYDREVATLKNQPVTAQKVMQPLIDKKYQGLQQKLDESAGKTSFAFNSKPSVIKDTPTMKATDLTSYEGAPDKARVAQYKADLQAGKSVKPLLVKRDSSGKIGIEDGKHRFEAMKQLGMTNIPVKEVPSAKVSGSALRTEQKAVQAGMKGESTGKATYDTVSHKQEAVNAVDLLHSDPQKAMKIAMGETAGNNASHEAAVYHAVANDALAQAKKTGDYSTVTQLAASPRHTGVSEAAQKLGAEGYNVNPHDPIKLMNDVSKTRETAVAKRTGSTVTKETANISKQVKSNTLKVSREDWHSFVESLKC